VALAFLFAIQIILGMGTLFFKEGLDEHERGWESLPREE